MHHHDPLHKFLLVIGFVNCFRRLIRLLVGDGMADVGPESI